MEKLEQLIQELGFENSQIFLEKNGLGVDENMPFESFLQIQLRNYLVKEIQEWQKTILFFENKYQGSWKNLNTNFHKFTTIDELEKEADEVEWEMALAFVESYQKNLTQL